MPSGKQILISELQNLSQKKVAEHELSEVSDRLRACLLLHDSTAASAWPTVERISWADNDGVQGPALASNGVFLADLLSSLTESSEIPQAVKDAYPEIEVRDFRAGLHAINLLITQMYYFPEFSTVENGGDLDAKAAEELIINHISKLQHYRSDPEGHIGQSVESAEAEI